MSDKVEIEVEVEPYIHPRDEARIKGHYFDNYLVEQLVTKYVMGGCTNRKLRDEIMTHANELIRQIIRTHNLNEIYPGNDPASFGDLEQVAWCQLESMLYKFDHGPNHTKLFNLWSQVCKTVILAYIKKETRDRKNFPTYKGHVVNKGARPEYKLERFAEEARLVCGNNIEYNLILDAIIHLHAIDDKPYDGMIGKLVDISKLSRTKVSGFLKYLRYRQRDFSDAPVNDESSAMNKLVYDDGRRKTYNTESDDD